MERGTVLLLIMQFNSISQLKVLGNRGYDMAITVHARTGWLLCFLYPEKFLSSQLKKVITLPKNCMSALGIIAPNTDGKVKTFFLH